MGESVALVSRPADDGDLERAVEHALRGGERPAGEARRPLHQARHAGQCLLGGLPVPAGAGQGGVRARAPAPSLRGPTGRRCRRGRAAGRPGPRPSPTVSWKPPSSARKSRSATSSRSPATVQPLGRRAVAAARSSRPSASAPWSSSTAACRPTMAVARDPAQAVVRQVRVDQQSRGGAGRVDVLRHPGQATGGAEQLMASPFQAATTLSSRAGPDARGRGPREGAPDPREPRRVVGFAQQLQGRGAVLEGAAWR